MVCDEFHELLTRYPPAQVAVELFHADFKRLASRKEGGFRGGGGEIREANKRTRGKVFKNENLLVLPEFMSFN